MKENIESLRRQIGNARWRRDTATNVDDYYAAHCEVVELRLKHDWCVKRLATNQECT